MCLYLVAEWLSSGTLQKVVLVVTSAISKEVLERWTFDIQTNKAAVTGDE
jgi:mitotic spindle assembly checkpoint protein MAD2